LSSNGSVCGSGAGVCAFDGSSWLCDVSGEVVFDDFVMSDCRISVDLDYRSFGNVSFSCDGVLDDGLLNFTGLCVDVDGNGSGVDADCDVDGDVCLDGVNESFLLAPDCSYCSLGWECMSEASNNFSADGLCAGDNDCCLGDFVEGGYCGCAEVLNGESCDDDVDGVFDGVCAYTGVFWTCETGSVYFDGTFYRTGGSGLTDGYRCMSSDVSLGVFVQDGLGVSGECVNDSIVVCPDGLGGDCFEGCDLENNNSLCDPTLSSGDFLEEGRCGLNSSGSWVCGYTPSVTSDPLVVSADVTASYNNDFVFWCNGTLEDSDGFSDITSVYGVFYHSDGEFDDGDDLDVHYTNRSCSQVVASDTSVNVSCLFDVSWFAEPGDWSCMLFVGDSLGLTGSLTRSDITLSEFSGLAGEGSLSFGSLTPGDTTLVGVMPSLLIENRGNVELDVNITSSGDFACDSGVIDDGSVHYGVSEVSYDGLCGVGSSCNETELDFDLRKRGSEDAANPVRAVYFAISVPLNVKGSCSTSFYYEAV